MIKNPIGRTHGIYVRGMAAFACRAMAIPAVHQSLVR